MSRGRKSDDRLRNQRRTANRRLRELEDDIAKRTGRCLFVIDDSGEYCDEPVDNNCHIVPESAVLDGLRDDRTKKVLELQWGVSQWRELLFSDGVEQRVRDSNTFDPSERKTGVVCVGQFACKTRSHDDEFHPIDVAEPDFDDPEVRLLAGLRLMQFQPDQMLLGLELHQKRHKAVMRTRGPQDRASWVGEKVRLTEALRKGEPTLKLLGKHWNARKTGGEFDPDIVSARVLSFRSKLRLAGGLSYGKATAASVFLVEGRIYSS